MTITKVDLYLTRDRKAVTTNTAEAGFLLHRKGKELDEKLLRNLGLTQAARELAKGEEGGTLTDADVEEFKAKVKAAAEKASKQEKAAPEDKQLKAAPEDKGQGGPD